MGGPPRRTLALVAALALALGLCDAPATGQTTPTPDRAGADPDSMEVPSMPDAPRQFALGGGIAWLGWGSGSERGEVDDAPLYGISLERLLLPYLSLRASGLYGASSIAAADAETDVNQWVAELALLGRLPIDPLEAVGVVPYAALVGGAVVHDPDDPELITRSQTALGFGAGVEIDIAHRIGGRLDWRHLYVQLEDVFDPQNRSAVEVEANRIGAGFFWRF